MHEPHSLLGPHHLAPLPQAGLGQIAAHSWLNLSEHNIEGCDCAAHKKYRSLEIHEEHCSDNHCVLEWMVRKAPGRSVPSRAALMAW